MYLDVSRYTRAPRIGAASGFTLTVRLLRVAPRKPSKRVLACLERLREKAERLQEVLRERARLRSFSLRPFDQDFDASWGAFVMRIQAHARSPRSLQAQRADELLADLLPDGLSFLALTYEGEWLHSHTLLQRFEAEGLLDELDELAGGTFLSDVREAHAALGSALGMGDDEPETVPTLLEPLTELAHAIADYGRILAGEVDVNDPESVRAFQAAMAPRDAHVARRRRGKIDQGGEGGEDVQDEQDEADEPELLEAELPALPELEELGP